VESEKVKNKGQGKGRLKEKGVAGEEPVSGE